MSKMNYGKVMPYAASGAIAPYRIVKFGASDGVVSQTSANTDKMIGVVVPVGENTFADAETVEVVRTGLVEVQYGGNVTRGDILTSDSLGRAISVTAAMAQAGNIHVIGQAEESGVLNDIGSVFLFTGRIAPLSGPADCAFTVGTENTNVVIVSGQLKDGQGNALTIPAGIQVYLSDNADGSTIVATAPSGNVQTNSQGLATALVAKKLFFVTTDSSGRFDFTITEAGAKTLYVVASLPTGLKVSSAVTFAA